MWSSMVYSSLERAKPFVKAVKEWEGKRSCEIKREPPNQEIQANSDWVHFIGFSVTQGAIPNPENLG